MCGNTLKVGKFFDGMEEARLPQTRACRAAFKAKEDHLALAGQELSQLLTGHFSTPMVVVRYGANKVLDGLTLGGRIHNHHRDSFLHGSSYGALERNVIIRRQNNAAHPLGNKLLNDLDLLPGVILL